MVAVQGHQGKKLANVVLTLNWVILAFGTLSAVGYFAYNAGEFQVITAVLKEFESAITSTNDTDTYEDYKGKNLKEANVQAVTVAGDDKAPTDADEDNDADLWGGMNGVKTELVMKGKLITAHIVLHAVLTTLLALGIRKQHFTLLIIWMMTNGILVVISGVLQIYVLITAIVEDQASEEFGLGWNLYQFLRMTWMWVSVLPIFYFSAGMVGISDATDSEKTLHVKG